MAINEFPNNIEKITALSKCVTQANFQASNSKCKTDPITIRGRSKEITENKHNIATQSNFMTLFLLITR